MRTYNIKCEGESHHIVLYDNGSLELLNHDMDKEETQALFGFESTCYWLMQEIYKERPDRILRKGVVQNSRGMIRLALACGARVEQFAYYSLRTAISLGNTRMVLSLLERIDTIDKRLENDMITLAINRGNADILWLLLESGVKPSCFLEGTVRSASRSVRFSSPFLSVLREYYEIDENV